MDDEIRFCAAPDGVRIAYATCGSGRPLVRAATWLTHLDYDWQIYPHLLTGLSAEHRLVRYDLRGCGLSDRDAVDQSLDARVGDLGAVIDACGADRVALLGLSGGGPAAIAYAVHHPERVSHLILYGSYALGRARRATTDAERAEDQALVALTRSGWGAPNPAFRRLFTTLYMPDATLEEIAAFDEVQRVATSAETAARIREVASNIDVVDLARQVRVPTLVLHVRDDAAAPFEEGRRLAGLIPGARLVPLPGRNHILGPRDEACQILFEQIRRFTADDPQEHADPAIHLTPRERDILRLVAAGLDNDTIARDMYLSPRTVERHLSNVYTKLGVSGRSARAAAASHFARHA
ncbi:MAG TPA: alpha/beta fold hydrolase [Mycobacteriales bacterium]|nr:alpha/beta fold hydrolase [Mycobacteriales bacterium]